MVRNKRQFLTANKQFSQSFSVVVLAELRLLSKSIKLFQIITISLKRPTTFQNS